MTQLHRSPAGRARPVGALAAQGTRPGIAVERALELVLVDPRRATAVASAAVAQAAAERDWAAVTTGQRVLGLAAHAMHDAAAAAAHLRRAITTAGRHGLAVAGAEARMSHALVLDDLGRPRAALREIDRACAVLTGL